MRTIRLAALEDSPSAFGSSHAAEAVRPDHEWAERAVAGSTGSRRVTFFVEDSVEVVGLVGGYRAEAPDDVVEVVSMWVAPRLRGRGAGRALLDAVIEWAAETDAVAIGLWVTCGNTPAETLYESMGFAPTGERQPLPSDPSKAEVRMVRQLSELSGDQRA